MDTSILKLFVEVARLGGFAAAARRHELDPSSLSRSVASLEAELGLRLFHRSTRKLSLTEAGHSYLARVAPLVDELDFAREEALALIKGATGVLRMTTSVAFCYRRLAPLLPTFLAQHPGLKLDLLITDTNLHLINDRVDLALRMGSSFDGDLVCTKLMPTRYRVCASPAYLRQKGAPKHPQELEDHSCLLLALPEFRNQWHFKDALGLLQSVTVTGPLVISNPLVQSRCALEGMGPALLADWLVNEELAAGSLVDLFPNYHVAATRFDTGVWLLYPSRSYLPFKVRAIIDFLKAAFSLDDLQMR